MATEEQQAWFLRSSYPVSFPSHEALTKPRVEFDSFISGELRNLHVHDAAVPEASTQEAGTEASESETFTLVTDTTSAEIRKDLADLNVGSDNDTMAPTAESESPTRADPQHPFMQGLTTFSETSTGRSMDNMMLTENGDLAYRSTNSALVDLFTELEDVVSGPRLRELLDASWRSDPVMTLKIIFNARSIHLGKSSKTAFYRCAGWLAQNHPLTLIANLCWLSRPVIKKKVDKEGEEDIVLVEEEKNADDVSRFDVKYGVAHGYWKDLLNILVLAVNDQLTVLSNPRDILNSENPGIIHGMSFAKSDFMVRQKMKKARRAAARARRGEKTLVNKAPASFEEAAAKTSEEVAAKNPEEARRLKRDQRHEKAVEAFQNDTVYRALHLTVARLFAEQLTADLAALRGNDTKAKRSISLCGKWAPSRGVFHDKHTFIISSIAEIMYPRESLNSVLSPTDDRDTYLLWARERYRKDVSALRRHLAVVERDLSAKTLTSIKYDRVPSVAMQNYSGLFIKKDLARFETYIERVAEGKSRISGATLLPSKLVKAACEFRAAGDFGIQGQAKLSPKRLVELKMDQLQTKVVDGQWKTLVQRIKDSGTLSSSMAICDVSGSMTYPTFPDGTNPMDSSVGLSLLIAEVTQPPFGGSFITFDSKPRVVTIDPSETLSQKCQSMKNSPWGMTTDFVAVFRDLILPMAIKNKLKQADMVKRVFVFSDMQFDKAQHGGEKTWSTSFERIKKKFAKAGYEMPEMVFWNLSGGRAGYGPSAGDATAPKPVTVTEEGTSLVSGYSQGMLKVFLENGSFEDPEEDEEEDETVVLTKGAGDEDVTEEAPTKKKKMDPMSTVRKATSHKAYDMLKVLD